MPEEAALIDAPVDAVAEIDNAVDTTVDTSQSEVSEQSQTDETGGEQSLRGSALWRDVKAGYKEGKPLTAKQLSDVNKAIHRADAIDSKYPEGLSAIEQRLEALKPLIDDETVPFEQAVQAIGQERAYFRELDALFTSGKPEFVEKMAEASPEAFQSIAPAVFRKYAEVSPEGYSKYVSQAVVSHMNAAGVPMNFQVLEAFWPQVPDFPGKEQFQKALASVMNWSDSLKSMAEKQIEQKPLPQQNAQPGEDREAQLADRESRATIAEWNSSISTQSVGFVRSEAQKAAGKVQLTEAEHQKVLAKVKEEYTIRLQMDKKYDEAAKGYVKSGNRSAYIQRVQSEQKKLIPGAVRRAVSDVIEGRPKPGNSPVKGRSEAGNSTVTGKKPVNGQQLTGAVQFRRIAGPPRTLGMNVDLNRTTNTMLTKRTAYIMGEKNPVQWGPLARA